MSKSISPSPRHAQGFSLLRVLFCGILLTVLVAGCLYLHHTAFAFFRARMLEDESKTIAGLTGQLGFSLPFVVICLFHAAVYAGRDPHNGSVCREMFWEVALVTVLVYAVLLPYLSDISAALHTNALAAGEKIPQTDAKVDRTLLMDTHEWFVRLTIPLALLLVYHGSRARRERLYPETEAEPAPLMTVAEYEAMKAAEAAAETTEETVAEEAVTEETVATEGEASPAEQQEI